MKDLKSGESSDKSEKIGCFGLTMVLEGTVTPDVDKFLSEAVEVLS